MNKAFFLAFLGFFIASCDEQVDCCGPVEDVEMLFGSFYGFCGGETCIDIYKLTGSQLFEDTTDQYPSYETPYAGSFLPISGTYFDQVAAVREAFPVALFDEKETVIGMPDAGDWGGYYIEYRSGTNRKFWLIDKMRENVPTKYHAFLDLIDEKELLLENRSESL